MTNIINRVFLKRVWNKYENSKFEFTCIIHDLNQLSQSLSVTIWKTTKFEHSKLKLLTSGSKFINFLTLYFFEQERISQKHW